jgi:hypothetical protein
MSVFLGGSSVPNDMGPRGSLKPAQSTGVVIFYLQEFLYVRVCSRGGAIGNQTREAVPMTPDQVGATYSPQSNRWVPMNRYLVPMGGCQEGADRSRLSG